MHLTRLRITTRPGPFFYQRNPFKIQNKTLNIKRRSVYVHGWVEKPQCKIWNLSGKISARA